MPAPDALSSLTVHRFRAHLRPTRDLILPPGRRRAVLRGAFALTLRKLVCHDVSLACSACPLRRSCPYPAVFDPGAAEETPRILRLADPPRPFVVREETARAADRVSTGEPLRLDLHVVGRAIAQAPYLLATVDRLAHDGIGPHRVPLTLDRIDALDARGLPDAVALDPSRASMAPRAPALRAADLERPGDEIARVVRVRFTTPTLLREAGEVLRDAPFGALVRRLRSRLGALATLFGEGPLATDARDEGMAADAVALRSSDVGWERETRRSSRTRERHPLEGFVGDAVYEGDLARWMPLLRLGELLHVGKHASFGLGRIEAQVLA